MALPKSSGAIGLVALSVAGIVYTLVAGNQPLLGLDLQGGVSVVYEPETEATEETLDQTVEIIRERVDALGVAEPEISRQGQAIVVDLPGVDEQQRALDLVGQTAELRFRPVILELGPSLDLESLPDAGGDADSDTGETTPSEEAPTADTSTTDDGSDEEGMASSNRYRRQSDDAPADDAPADDAPAVDEEAPVEEDVPADQAPVEPELTPEQLAIQAEIEAACSIQGVTPPEQDVYERYVALDNQDGGRTCLGPALLRGDTLESADVGLTGSNQWIVNPVFKAGPTGIEQFNTAAALCFNRTDICPSGRLAIVLDGQVISAPNINDSSFARDRIEISGSFDETSARDLALVLNYGALPVVLEAQQTRTVSATIGDDVLQAGIIAGLIGLGIVAIYLLWYYRLAGLVAIGGLVMSFLLLWTIISWLGETRGLAITLSGVVGLIVSIGVSADSNIVYFENVKDAATNPKVRKLSTSVERAYQSAISTILKADVVSLIAAALLYFLTVGAVRGFAFYLGIATFLDLIVSYVFMRPALMWIAQRPAVQKNPRLLGLRQPLGGVEAKGARS